MHEVFVYTDGGSRGNPGNAAIGVFIRDEKNTVLFSNGETIGIATNNVAEYKAVIKALSFVLTLDQKTYQRVECFLDSELVCRQINGVYKMKNENLRPLLFTIQEALQKLSIPIRFTHIPREKNKEADRLVNEALDKQV